MRIISKFRDYYDIGQSLGFDSDIVYVRNLVDLGSKDYDARSFWYACSGYGDAVPVYIGFCGKIYFALRFPSRGYNTWKTFHGDDATVEYRRNRLMLKQSSSWLERRELEEMRKAESKYLSWFHEHKVPIFAVWGCRAEFAALNPPLGDLEFFRVFDPWSAYQEIAMFIGGVLGSSERATVDIEDKYRIAVHGYDSGSFRAPKNTKPARKRRK